MRKQIVLDAGWRFHYGDAADAGFMGYDDRGWRKVTLPHDWAVEHPFDICWASGTGYLPGGTAWYRKHFTLTAEEAAGRVILGFQGVYKHAKVWVNSNYLGSHAYGYTRGSVYEKIGISGRKNYRFGFRSVEVIDEVDRILIYRHIVAEETMSSYMTETDVVLYQFQLIDIFLLEGQSHTSRTNAEISSVIELYDVCGIDLYHWGYLRTNAVCFLT